MNLDDLKYWLRPKKKLFADFEDYVLDSGDPKKNRIFVDRGSDVLFVAHIDTVCEPKFVRLRKTKSKKSKRIYAQGLDDRLGCMLASELSAEFNTDLLICDNEETCQSTGVYHNLKGYNWIAEFDRAGQDVVTYDRDNEEFRNVLKEFWDIGYGTYSDVVGLETSACCVNIGIGYELAHSIDSYATIKVMDKQVEKFRLFFDKYKDVEFIADEPDVMDLWLPKKMGFMCDICGSTDDVELVFNHSICRTCFNESMLNQLYKSEFDYYQEETIV